MSERARMFRFHIGRWLLVAGLRALPRGPVQAELSALYDQWSTKVYRALDATALKEPIGQVGEDG